MQRVDLARLRGSLAQQIIAAYLRVTGRAGRLGSFGDAIVAGIGATTADPIRAKIVTPENLIKLFGDESMPTEAGDLSLKFGSLSAWLKSGSKAWAQF
jgi:hypothetical protein